MNSVPLAASYRTDPEIHRLLDLATGKLRAYQQEPASQLEGDLGEVQNAVSLLRNRMIQYYRAEEHLKPDDDLRIALKKINTALSHIVGVEYPVAGINRSMLAQANDLLQALPGVEKR